MRSAMVGPGRVAALLLAVSALHATTPHALAQAGRPLTADSQRECVICHLSWADAFDRPGAIPLIDEPPRPVVAESQVCLGCHDGSVGDSRRRVWAEHGHRTGIQPPPGMSVPAELPLENGQIVCRTCHNAHGGQGPESIATIVFLRVPNESSQLCHMCHPDMAKGPELGTHPVGGMPWPVPQELLDAGAKAGPAEFRLICQTCHTSHGAAADDLLVMGTESSQLCLTCHTKLRPGMWRPDVEREHPQNPPLQTPEQHQAIANMGTQVGPDGTLICLSCHKLHDGLAGRAMLADTLHDSRLCLRCHPQRDEMFGTPHDLRQTAPDTLNRLGQTIEQSGPCGACHSFHSFARQPEPTAADRTGLCTSCHQPNGVAGGKTGLPLSHPVDVDPTLMPAGIDLRLYPPRGQDAPLGIACLSCHDPHALGHKHFLRDESGNLCATCHPAAAANLAGGHDFTGHPDITNARGQTGQEAGKCGFCHAAHDALGPFMWVATKDAPETPDELCTTCHQEGGLAKAKTVPLLSHPTGPKTLRPPTTPPPDEAAFAPADVAALVPPVPVAGSARLPLFDATTRKVPGGFVACGSCHDPHAGTPHSPDLLRVENGGSTLCLGCHPQQSGVRGGKHDVTAHPEGWPHAAPDDPQLCFGCHQAHSNHPAKGLWTVQPVGGVRPFDAACVACHPSYTWVKDRRSPAIGAALHPQLIPQMPDETPHPFLAPADAADVPNAALMACQTCHDPHAGAHTVDFLRGSEVGHRASVCFACHEQASHIEDSLHSAAAMGEAHVAGAQVCGPCHAVHAVSDSVTTELWAMKLNPAGRDPSQQRCLACHGPGGPGKAPHVVEHPEVFMPQLPQVEQSVLAPIEHVLPNNRVTCITCHVPHGYTKSAALVTVAPEEVIEALERPGPKAVEQAAPQPAAATRPTDTQPYLALLSAATPMLRPNVGQQICSVCHGYDGVSRFLYYHRPQLRERPLLPFGEAPVKPVSEAPPGQ